MKFRVYRLYAPKLLDLAEQVVTGISKNVLPKTYHREEVTLASYPRKIFDRI